MFRQDGQWEPIHEGREALEWNRAVGALGCSNGGQTAAQGPRARQRKVVNTSSDNQPG